MGATAVSPEVMIFHLQPEPSPGRLLYVAHPGAYDQGEEFNVQEQAGFRFHPWCLARREKLGQGCAGAGSSGASLHRIDLPGSGTNAASPVSFSARPFDPAAFATEPSPNAGVTQEDRTAAAIEAVKAAAAQGNGKVVLAGHSLGRHHGFAGR